MADYSAHQSQLEPSESDGVWREQPNRNLLIRRVWGSIIVFLGIVVPILSLYNCPNCNEGTGIMGDCRVFNGSLARGISDFSIGLVLMFAFSGGIFLVIYLFFLWMIYKLGCLLLTFSFHRLYRSDINQEQAQPIV